MMRQIFGTFLLLIALAAIIAVIGFLIATTAQGYAPTNPPAEIQPDETFTWECDMYVPLSTVLTSTATYLQGGTGTCTGLLSAVTVNGTKVTWTWTPGSMDPNKEHQCWIHILAQATGGSKYACDGKVVVKKNRPVS